MLCTVWRQEVWWYKYFALLFAFSTPPKLRDSDNRSKTENPFHFVSHPMKVPTDFPSCLGIPEWCHKPLNSKYMCSGRNALYVSLYNKRPRSYFPVFIFLHTRFHHYHRHCWQQKQQQLTHPLCLLFLLEYSLSLVWLMLWKICLFRTHFTRQEYPLLQELLRCHIPPPPHDHHHHCCFVLASLGV